MTDVHTPPALDESRGEFPLQIGNIHIGIAVTFSGLARLAQVAGTDTMSRLQQRLLGFDPHVVPLAIKLMSVDADGPPAAVERADAALTVLSAADEDAWCYAITLALAHHVQAGKLKRDEDAPDMVAQVRSQMARAPDVFGDDDDTASAKKKPRKAKMT